MKTITNELNPQPDCGLCTRLAAFRHEWQAQEPDWFNAPVPVFGALDAQLAIIGLAPGLRGANRTGRPFTGDFAGDLLYQTLSKYGLSNGTYDARPDDGVELINAAIINAVRCVPPQNKPTTEEIRNCNAFLRSALDHMTQLTTLIALGKIAHDAILTAYGHKKAHFKFAHGAQHRLTDNITLFDSYHCSRYNTNTGVLTEEMFEAVFTKATADLSP